MISLLTLLLLTSGGIQADTLMSTIPFEGTYVIDSALDPSRLGVDSAEARLLLGKRIEIRSDRVVFQDTIHYIGSYRVEYNTNEYLQRTSGSCCPPMKFSDLGYNGSLKYLYFYEFTFSDEYWGWGKFVYYFDVDHMIVALDGAYYRLKRIS